jgi:NADH:ubiquinone oxidoreductase subunit 5 (subunit L)/multisubunit Na+/H+ antiporter MnhA subunit
MPHMFRVLLGFSTFFFLSWLVRFVGFIFLFFLGGVQFDYCFRFAGFLDFSLTFVFDYLSLGFFSCVSFISGCVFLFTIFYMGGSLDYRRFILLVLIFVGSMFVLVFSGNFLFLIIG